MYMGPDHGGQIMKNSNFKSTSNRSAPTKYRTILHIDANSFFATCETALHPEYNLVPMAVCGSAEDRHGIVLATNALAKKYGVKTAETLWSAKQKCPNLLLVRPTYGLYEEISRKMNRIFYDYTDLVEPFGIDESWLDVTASKKLFGGGKAIADAIRGRIKQELGITVSVGVSFNKVFAKLGSDLKKPDATTIIPPQSFASVIWDLPVNYLLFVGPSCARTLNRIGIKTIGDLACANPTTLKEYLGKTGVMLQNFAAGQDYAPVTPMGYEPTPKSVSNGMTFRANLATPQDISFAVTYLSMSVAERLRKHGLCCNTVAVTIRTPNQQSFNRQAPLNHATCLYSEISKKALDIIAENQYMHKEIYSLTVHAEKLSPAEDSFQQQLFADDWELNYKKHYSLESAVDSIRARFGRTAIGIASAVKNPLIV